MEDLVTSGEQPKREEELILISKIQVFQNQQKQYYVCSFEFDPRIRHTFWSIVIGGTLFWVGINGFNQAQVQRYVCCKSKTHAR